VLPDGPLDPTNSEPCHQGVRFVPVYTAHRRDGSVSLQLFQIELD